jgi:uncharacterized protein YndB with AHSA1/START domain
VADGLNLHLETVLPVSPDEAFAAFDAQRLGQWFGPVGFTVPDLQFEPAEGAEYRLALQPPEGEVFHISGTFGAVEAARRLTFTFVYEEPDPDDEETLVTLAFEPTASGTRLVLDQAPFKTEPRRELHRVGWTETFERLAQYLR